jgi:hypothetical protein
VACGSADGSVACWQFDGGGGAAARLSALELAGTPVHALDWSRRAGAAAAAMAQRAAGQKGAG